MPVKRHILHVTNKCARLETYRVRGEHVDGGHQASARRVVVRRHGPLWGLVVLLTVISPAFPVTAHGLDARRKPGPVTLRGVAAHVRLGGFALHTRTHGTLAVTVSAATRWLEKGKRGRPVLHDGDHVGVRGFLQGQAIHALQIRIYPTKPKAFSMRGTVTAIAGSDLSVTAAGRTVKVRITSATVIHIGKGSGALRNVRVGDRVDVRIVPASGGDVALLLHVYRRAAGSRSLTLHGTVAAVSSGTVAVRSGKAIYHVALAHSTRVYLGRRHSSVSALAVGQTVTVHACCAGRALVATSVHIGTVRSSHVTTLYQGTVVAVSATQLRLVTSAGSVTIWLSSATTYRYGVAAATRGNVHAGDRVSVRAYRQGASLVATRVHIYVVSHKPRTIVGPVSAVTSSGLIVIDRGHRYTVRIAPGTRVLIDGKLGNVKAIRPGDHVHAVGLLQGTVLAANQVTVKRPAAKRQTVRGTIAWIQGNRLTIVDDAGGHHQVRLASGVQVTLRGKQAPVTDLFPGARATAKGIMEGQTLVASSLTLSLRTKTVRGQVAALGKKALTVRTTGGLQVRIDLPAKIAVADPGSSVHPAVLHVGSYVRIQGYVEPSGAVRAFAIEILHPSVSASATIVAAAPTVTVRTSKDLQFQLRFAGSSQISVSRLDVPLQPADLAVGMRVHVQGVIQSDGTLLVDTLVVRLTSLTVRGQISAVTGQVLSVQTAAGQMESRLLTSTTFVQGSHTLILTDLVVGDDVTVYGYRLRADTMLVRKVLVHRKLVGLDGTVNSPRSDGFTLTAADGTHRVVMGVDTIITGGVAGDVVAGAVVHVAGYLRGDGVVLATRLRIVKKA